MKLNIKILFVAMGLSAAVRAQTQVVQHDSCYIFVEYHPVNPPSETARTLLRKKYAIVQYEVYNNINPNWEGWILPNCNATALIQLLSKDEKTILKRVGLNYIGSLDAPQPVNRFVAAKTHGQFSNFTTFLAQAYQNLFRKKNNEKIHIAFLDGFKDTIDHGCVKFHSVVEGEVTEKTNEHAYFVYSNFKTYLNEKQMVIHKIKVSINGSDITYRNILKAINLHCVPNQVTIVNMSLVFKEATNQSEYSNFLSDCLKNLESTIVFVCAVGNDNIDLDKDFDIKYCPAHLAATPDCKNVIAVGAVDGFKHFVCSNRGKKSVTIAAKARFGSDCSSYATPIVTGLIARAGAKQKMSPEQSMIWLKQYASHASLETRFGYIHGVNSARHNE
jgi:Subtilase family